MTPPDQVDLWFIQLDELLPEADLAPCRAVMDEAELTEERRFRHAGARTRYVVARALVRHVLSQYTAIAPRDWKFDRTSHGKPFVISPDAPALAFNLSHTEGMVACAISGAGEIGVDVENTTRHAPLDVADRWFARPEVQALRILPKDAQPSRFFDYWTLKEAYIKGRGLGLSLPLDTFWFVLDDGPPELNAAADFDDDPSSWQFQQLDLSPIHRAAIAVRRPAHSTLLRCTEKRIGLEMFR